MERRELRSGFTTGTCAAGAAKAAAVMLLTGGTLERVSVVTPKGPVADLELFFTERKTGRVVCAVKKDAGDDPDVTDQAFVYASVEYPEAAGSRDSYYRRGALLLTGGPGVGIVTKGGLACPVGKYAINPVPQKMIFDEVEAAAQKAGFEEELLIRIWIPEGVNLAAGTFNPKLGIEGGISVLGTSGIVEPMSEAALIATIRLELHMKAVAGGKKIIMTPGNYGERFLKDTLGLSLEQGIQCSNFVAESVEMAREEGLDTILFIGHIGKLIKVAGGVRNTHSRYGDKRMEILWDCTEEFCRDFETGKMEGLREAVLNSNTTEEAVAVLEKTGILSRVMSRVVERIKDQIITWFDGPAKVEVITFSTGYGLLGMTAEPSELLHMIESFRTQG